MLTCCNLCLSNLFSSKKEEFKLCEIGKTEQFSYNTSESNDIGTWVSIKDSIEYRTCRREVKYDIKKYNEVEIDP
jgi:hypothetical protein